MSITKHCLPIGSGSPAQATTPPPKTGTELFIDDWFDDPEQIQDMRRHLRTWFLENVQHWDENFGQTLQIQILHYEVLDELLSVMIQETAKQQAK